jgi:hypothetical protein
MTAVCHQSEKSLASRTLAQGSAERRGLGWDLAIPHLPDRARVNPF